MSAFHDHIVGAESDCGVRLLVSTCPACATPHILAVTRLDGRFMFTCGDRYLGGQVRDWPTNRAKALASGQVLTDSTDVQCG